MSTFWHKVKLFINEKDERRKFAGILEIDGKQKVKTRIYYMGGYNINNGIQHAKSFWDELSVADVLIKSDGGHKINLEKLWEEIKKSEEFRLIKEAMDRA